MVSASQFRVDTHWNLWRDMQLNNTQLPPFIYSTCHFSYVVELPFIGQKLYVDPTIYDSPEDALNEFASELDPTVLVLEKLIGGGMS